MQAFAQAFAQKSSRFGVPHINLACRCKIPHHRLKLNVDRKDPNAATGSMSEGYCRAAAGLSPGKLSEKNPMRIVLLFPVINLSGGLFEAGEPAIPATVNKVYCSSTYSTKKES